MRAQRLQPHPVAEAAETVAAVVAAIVTEVVAVAETVIAVDAAVETVIVALVAAEIEIAADSGVVEIEEIVLLVPKRR